MSTILLVEDDEILRENTAELLRELGHLVVEAASAEAAMLLLNEGQRADILLTDIGLPGESGEVFAAEARALRPGLRIVFVTGRGSVPDASGEGFSPLLLRKPFSMEELSAALARAR